MTSGKGEASEIEITVARTAKTAVRKNVRMATLVPTFLLKCRKRSTDLDVTASSAATLLRQKYRPLRQSNAP